MSKCKKTLRFLLLVLLFLNLAACSTKQPKETFKEYTNELFQHEASSNSISCNYLLSNPDQYDVKIKKATLGSYTEEGYQKDLAYYENMLARLEQFDRKKLSAKEQLTYDLLEESLIQSGESGAYFYLMESLGPTTGIQAQLPILLSEYNYNDKNTIQQYLDVLKIIPVYFDDIITVEKAKAQLGNFMSTQTADDIIAQCEKFIENPDENLLITIFDNRMDALDSVIGQVKKEFKVENKVLVKTKVIPSYEKLIKALEKLKSKSVNQKGLCSFQNGKTYYEYLVKSTTGSNRSIDEIRSLIQTYMTKSSTAMVSLMGKEDNYMAEAENPSYPTTDPRETLDYLKEQIASSFPAIPTVNVTVKEVDPSLEDFVSPAFYLSPTIDDYKNNLIYINNGKNSGMNNLFSTLAHEGYPGHLYQTVFFNSQKPDPIRQVLTYGGYTEGWATYCELYSYNFSKLKPGTVKLLQHNTIYSLCIYALCDIGINYDGWTKESTTTYLKSIGIDDEKSANSIYNSMVAEPANYMKYTLGYIEFAELKKRMKELAKDDYTDMDFHDFVLTTGPSSFTVLNEQITTYLSKK